MFTHVHNTSLTNANNTHPNTCSYVLTSRNLFRANGHARRYIGSAIPPFGHGLQRSTIMQ